MDSKIFENIGLSVKESKVLFALLELGSAKMTVLGEKTGIPRTSLYPIVQKLAKRGLVHEVVVRNHKEWQAIAPKEIYKNARENLRILESAVPELENLQDQISVPKEESEILYYRSEAGVKKAYQQLLKLRKGERIYGIEGSGSIEPKWFTNKKSREFIEGWQIALRKSKIILDIVASEKILEILKDMDKDMLRLHTDRMVIATLLPNELMDFSASMYVFRNTLMISSFPQNLAIFINNPEVAKIFKILFHIARQSGRKIDLNAEVKKFIEK